MNLKRWKPTAAMREIMRPRCLALPLGIQFNNTEKEKTMKSSTNRWWESYLVRYLMPSIAGAIIVNWMREKSQDLSNILFLPNISSGTNNINTATVVLLFLYGNLFCYISSFPILVFHGTRVLDNGYKGKVHYNLLNGYVWIVITGLISFGIINNVREDHRITYAILVAIVYSTIQCIKIYISTRIKIKLNDDIELTSPAYAYAKILAEERTGKENYNMRKDIMETYKHIREHGNSAYIFIHELVFGALCYVALFKNGYELNIKMLVVLLLIWVTPAMMVHYYGQHLERIFSTFNRKVRE